MNDRLRREEGSATVVAILIMLAILPIGFAALARVDNQSRQAGTDRVKESAFNLSEAALNGQAFQLARRWPGSEANPYPSACDPDTVDDDCPDGGSIAAAFDSADYLSGGASWRTEVRDNPGTAGAFYSEQGTATAETWDRSGPNGEPDGMVWLRAEATVGGRTRALVTLVSVEEQNIALPFGAITAGWMQVTNRGNKTLVHTGGSNVEVRCPHPPQSPGCLDYNPGSGNKQSQVSPNLYHNGYPGDMAIERDVLDRLRATAQSKGTYYTTCPPVESLSGTVETTPEGVRRRAPVFIENGNCSYGGNAQINSDDLLGMLVIGRGNFELKGTLFFYGRVYHANLDGVSSDDPPVVSINGNAGVKGAITVDGGGGVSIGSSGNAGRNLTYDDRVRQGVNVLSSAGYVQGRWRELRGG